MNTLIKPPCCNEGRTSNPAANAYLANLLKNSTQSKAEKGFTVLAKLTADKLRTVPELSGVSCIRNLATGQSYTAGQIYATCKKINNNNDLTFEELDGFLDDFWSYIAHADSSMSLEALIRDCICCDAESEFIDYVTSHEDFNEEAYENTAVRNQAIADLTDLLKYNPFTRLLIEIPSIARSYDILN